MDGHGWMRMGRVDANCANLRELGKTKISDNWRNSRQRVFIRVHPWFPISAVAFASEVEHRQTYESFKI